MSRAYIRGHCDKILQADHLDAAQTVANWAKKSAPIVTTFGADRKSNVTIAGEVFFGSNPYYLLVDLDNSGGEWPHNQTGYINVDNIIASVNWVSHLAKAFLSIGVITRIDGDSADVSYLWRRHVGRSNYNDGIFISDNLQPSSLTFRQESGNLIGALTSIKESLVAEINTNTALASPAGSTIPGVGDVVLKADYVEDQYNFEMQMLYHSN